MTGTATNTLGSEFRARLGTPPQWCIVAGSGLSAIADALTAPSSFSYDAFAGLPRPGVAGHAGQLLLGHFHEATVAVFCGRSHFYEGVDARAALAMIRGIADWGCRQLILTNAAGALNPAYRAGDLMLIRDHLNRIPGQLMASAFPSAVTSARLHPVYDPQLIQRTHIAAAQRHLPLHEGVYAANLGPSYETPAEAAALRRMGADAVGMSTAPEAMLARSLGVRVLGISCISNSLVHKSQASTTHEEVLANSTMAVTRLIDLLSAVIESH